MASPNSPGFGTPPLAAEAAGEPVADPLMVPRIALPRNLVQTLKRLDDVDLEALQRDVEAEVRRRRGGRSEAKMEPPAVVVTPAERQVKKAGPVSALPTGKASLIRASYRAGMKPSAIASNLRISRAVVNQVLGTQAAPQPKR